MLANSPIDIEQLREVLAERISQSVAVPDCEDYVGAFFKRASECEHSGDIRRLEGHVFFGRMCALRLEADPENSAPTLEATSVFSTIDTLSPEELAALMQLLPDVEDAALKARIADILWLSRARSRANHAIARIAVQAYVQSAVTLYDSNHQFGDLRATDKLVRALRIARRLGNAHPAVDDAKFAIETLLSNRKGQPAFPLADLVGELYDNGLGDARWYAQYSVELAEVAESSKNWRLAARYWHLAVGWWRRAGEEPASVEAFRRAAETNIGEADAALARPTPSNLVACHFVGQAIHALRAIPGQEDRREQLHKLMIGYQKAGISELVHIQSDPIDLKDARDASEMLVRGKDLLESVRTLAFALGRPPSVAKMRASVEGRGKSFIGMQIFGNTYLNQWGKTVDRRPAVGDKEDGDSRILAEMFHEARWSRNLRVLGMIDPMRELIWREHNIRLNDILPFVINNPFVPPDRIRLFARGIFAGFAGEMDVAVHLLVPQLENSIRYVLSKRGVIVSGFDDDGIQMEFDLNRILTALRPEVEKILGVDLTFELRGLLIERTGDNFRNELSHGLLQDAACFTATAAFTWWVVLHMCCVGWMLMHKDDVPGGAMADALPTSSVEPPATEPNVDVA